MVTYGALKTTNPDVAYERIKDIRALYNGGLHFEDRVHRFIFRSPADDEVSYARKIQIAKDEYRNFPSIIINYYSGFMFAYPISTRAMDDKGNTTELDPFYSAFDNSCDGQGTDFHDFVKGRFVESLISGCAYWAIEFPPKPEQEPSNKTEWEALGLGAAVVRGFEAEDVLDWNKDDAGELEWLITTELTTTRPSVLSPERLIVETFRIYDRQNITILRAVYQASRPPNLNDEIPVIATYAHGLARVPIIKLDCSGGLWLGDKMKGPATSHLRSRLRTVWALNTSGFSLPVLNTDSDDISRMFGRGTAIVMSKDDKFGWSNPPATANEAYSEEDRNTLVEIFRVCNLRFMSADQNVAWRSAKAKVLDADEGHVTLKSYATMIRSAVEKTYQMIAEGRGETTTFSAEDFEQLDEFTLEELTDIATKMSALQIPSPTLKREVFKEIAAQFGPDLAEPIKEKIRQEIEDATDEELMAVPATETIREDITPPATAKTTEEKPTTQPAPN